MSQSSVHTQTHIANGAIVEIGIEHTQVPLSHSQSVASVLCTHR